MTEELQLRFGGRAVWSAQVELTLADCGGQVLSQSGTFVSLDQLLGWLRV